MRFRSHILPAQDLDFVDWFGGTITFPFGDESKRRALYDSMSSKLAARGSTYAPVLANHDASGGALGAIVALEWVDDGIDAIIELNANGVARHLGAGDHGRMDYVSGGFDFGPTLEDLSQSELHEVSLTPVPQFRHGQRKMALVSEHTAHVAAGVDGTKKRLYVIAESASGAVAAQEPSMDEDKVNEMIAAALAPLVERIAALEAMGAEESEEATEADAAEEGEPVDASAVLAAVSALSKQVDAQSKQLAALAASKQVNASASGFKRPDEAAPKSRLARLALAVKNGSNLQEV